jgi:predicted GNAT superfamily acetyltransferase
MIGFVFGFPGQENGRRILHSDMLAVRPEYRVHGLGYKLKLAQRDRALANGIDTITWTYDPLQSLNAYLNIARLGVTAASYRLNYYGETSSFLHGNGTDRLWVTWSLDSERVRQRIELAQSSRLDDFDALPTLIRVGENEEPIISDAELWSGSLVIEIPANINGLRAKNAALAGHWRDATRNAFTSAIDAGFFVAEFYRVTRDGYSLGAYLLNKNREHQDPDRFGLGRPRFRLEAGVARRSKLKLQLIIPSRAGGQRPPLNMRIDAYKTRAAAQGCNPR